MIKLMKDKYAGHSLIHDTSNKCCSCATINGLNPVLNYKSIATQEAFKADPPEIFVHTYKSVFAHFMKDNGKSLSTIDLHYLPITNKENSEVTA